MEAWAQRLGGELRQNRLECQVILHPPRPQGHDVLVQRAWEVIGDQTTEAERRAGSRGVAGEGLQREEGSQRLAKVSESLGLAA